MLSSRFRLKYHITINKRINSSFVLYGCQNYKFPKRVFKYKRAKVLNGCRKLHNGDLHMHTHCDMLYLSTQGVYEVEETYAMHVSYEKCIHNIYSEGNEREGIGWKKKHQICSNLKPSN